MDCLVKRTLYPAQRLIIERNACADLGAQPREFVTIASIDGAVFRMVELNDAFRGEGRLMGPEWAWTSWQSRSAMPDGGSLDSSDKLNDSGLVAEKKYFGRDGKLAVLMHETLSSISEAEYQDRRRKLFPVP